MKPIVLVSYGGGHVTMLAPVARTLLERGTPIIFLALTTAGAYLERQGLSYIGYRHLPGAEDNQVQAWGHELACDLPTDNVVPLEESIAYMGLNYQDLVERSGEEEARQAYKSKGRHAFLPVALFKRWFSEVQPRLLLSTNSPRSERAAFEAARELGIPSVCVVDAFAMQEIQWIKQPNYATRICVLNEQVKQMFIQKGCQPDVLVATGNPAFERLCLPGTRKAAQIMRLEKGWGNNEKVILFASQPEPAKHPFENLQGDPSLPRRIEAHLREFIATQPNFRLVVRYHPSEQGVLFQNGQERVSQSIASDDLAVLLNAVDIVVNISSTVGLEGYLAGKPVLSVRGSVFDSDMPSVELGMAIEVKNIVQIDDLLINIDIIRQSLCAEQYNLKDPTGSIIRTVDSIL